MNTLQHLPFSLGRPFRMMPFVAAFIVCGSAFSQDHFEGSITYHVEYRSKDPSLMELSSALPAVTVYTVKGKQSIFEQSLAGGGTQAMITNAESGNHTLVMVFMGKEYRVDLSDKELETVKSNAELPLVETAESKEILGYECRLVWGITPGDSIKIYYAPELTSEVNLPPFEGLKGLPLQYDIVSDGMNIRYTAVKVNNKTIEPEKFIADPDMKKIAFSEFAKSFAIMN